MSVYTIHIKSGDETGAEARFIREGFSIPALIFGPLWLLAHRLWLEFLVFAALSALISALATLLQLPDWADGAMEMLLMFYLGWEGNQLRRNALQRRGWISADVVSSKNLESAERIFYSRWPRAAARHDTPPAQPLPHAVTFPGNDILGLFPQKGM